jgi:hypothetical protein
MTHYVATTLSSVNFNHSSFLALQALENANFTLDNVSSTLASAASQLPPESPYNFSQKIFIGTLFVILSLLTVIGNFMVRNESGN